jgi:hypothetical protein
MNEVQTDTLIRPEKSAASGHLQLPEEWKEELRKFQANVTARPFLYLAIAFFAGFVSQTFPVRLIFAVLMRVVSWISGPAILVLGAVKISELFRKSQGF